MKITQTIALIAGTLTLFSSAAQGIINMTANQIGSNVIFSYSGSANLDGLVYDFPAFVNSNIVPTVGNIIIGSGVGTAYNNVAATSFGSTFVDVDATSTEGPIVGVVVGEFGNNQLIVPEEYSSGMSLGTGSSTFADTSLNALGMSPGTYTWTWGSEVDGNADSLVLTVNAVPEPEVAALGLTGLALGAGGLRRWRKQVTK